jgi:DNA/RNA-binding domain of Phe-tRNA-synthetase-like protein
VPRFAYDPPIIERFPTVVGGVIHAVGTSNAPSPAPLIRAFQDEQTAVRARIGDRPLSELPSLAAWRRAFRAFGVDPTAYRSAAEALLRRLTKGGSIPSISALVDVGNLVSIRHALPVAVLDQRLVRGGTSVRFATGSEAFTDLASGESASPEPGEVIFIDTAGLVSARRWCWRQSLESASGPETSEVVIAVEAHHERAAVDVAAAVADLEALLAVHATPSASTSAILGPGAPTFDGLGT